MSFQVTTLQSGATATGAGTAPDTTMYDQALQVEVAETAGGTATVQLQGSFDGANWYAVGYQQVDAIAAPSRATANLAVAANSRHVYQLLDPYPQVRANISAIAGGGNVTVKLYGIR